MSHVEACLDSRYAALPTRQSEPVERTAHDGMPPGLPRVLAVATITIGLSMSVLNNSMTNLALPYIAHDLGITAESSIWIVNASQIALMVSCCRSRRWPTSWATATSTAAAWPCSASPRSAACWRPRCRWLIAARTLPGAGRRRRSWRSSRRWCARSIRATCWAAAWASTRRWSRPRWRPARRSARRC